MRTWIVLVVSLGVAGAASAQDRRWEIEGYAGALVGQPTSAGTRTLPPAGPPIVTSTPTFPSRAVPSWYFGDGAALLNGVLQDFGLPSRITPLDVIFKPIEPRRTPAFGLRVRRWLTDRTTIEISVEGRGGRSIDTAPLTAAVDTSSTEFGAAFHDLFSSGPFSAPRITTLQLTSDAAYSETAVTAAFNRDLGRHARLQPYFTTGGGAVFPTKFVFSGSVNSRYTTAVVGEVPIAETDLIGVHVSRSPTFAVVAGGGVRRDLSRRWVLRLDARWLIGPDSTRITVDAQPTVAVGTPAGFIESFTNPAIQFSNDPSTGRISSLSGAPLRGVEVFHGGVTARTIVSAALALRF